jgi:hypothetical protein
MKGQIDTMCHNNVRQCPDTNTSTLDQALCRQLKQSLDELYRNAGKESEEVDMAIG